MVENLTRISKYNIAFVLLCILVFVTPLLAPTIYASGPIAPDFYKAWFLQVGSLVTLGFYFFTNGKIKINAWHLSLFAFLCWAALSLFWAFHLTLALIDLSRWVAFGVVFFVATQIIKTKEQANIILFALWLSAVVITLIGLGQFFKVPVVKNLFLQAISPASTFGNKNMAMHFIVLMLPLTLWFFIKAKQSLHIVLVALAGALMLAYIFHSQNRASFLALILETISFIVFFIWMKKRNNGFKIPKEHGSSLIFAGILLVLLVNLSSDGISWFGDVFYNRYLKAENYTGNGIADSTNSFEARKFLLVDTLYMIKDHWFKGVGIGNWTIFFPQATGNYDLISHMAVSKPTSTILYKKAHNEYTQLFAELGIVGVSLIGYSIYLWVKGFGSLLKKKIHNENIWLIILSAIGIIGLFINMGASFPFRVSVPLMVIAIYLAVWYFYLNTAKEEKVETNKDILKKKNFWKGNGIISFGFSSSFNIWAGIFCIVAAFYVGNVYSGKWIPAHKLRNISAGYLMRGNFDTSLKKIKESLAINPNDADDGYYILGNLYKAKKLYTRAIATYEYALKYSLPYHPYMFTQLHQAYLLSGNTGKAIETLERAIRLMPKQDGYYAYLGSLYARIGDSRKAIELYKKTLEMNPVHPKAKVMKFLINKYTKSLNNQK